MQEGFIPGQEGGAPDVPRWIAGKPQVGFMGGVKIGGKVRHEVRTFRCTKCGYLESYAPGS
jgi:hypothetical protein